MITMPSIDMVATGKNIARMRKAAGLKVKDLQALFGFATPQAIYKWQHGAAMPTIDNLVALAMIFGVSMEDIIVLKIDAREKICA
ncbi:MAG: helix-turn-helix transcriptional regulator [Butyrivibrio sp.]|nr:helix-turn-helix transcriptional regulator [Butyrivibrio sp.]